MEIIRYDFDTLAADGNDTVTDTLLNILNEYPGLYQVPSDEITFQILDTVSGIAMFPTPNIAIISEKKDITGHVIQKCVCAFTVVYRTRIGAYGKEQIKEWLDNLGRWLDKQPIKIDGVEHVIDAYPKIDDAKTIDIIQRTTQGYLNNTTTDKAEDWAISMQMIYINEFDRD